MTSDKAEVFLIINHSKAGSHVLKLPLFFILIMMQLKLKEVTYVYETNTDNEGQSQDLNQNLMNQKPLPSSLSHLCQLKCSLLFGIHGLQYYSLIMILSHSS